MDFKNWQIIKTDKEVKVRPKYEIDWRFPIGVYNENEIDLYQAFETYANAHTYTLANPKDLPENATEVSREDMSEPEWQYYDFVKGEWRNISEEWSISIFRKTRQVAYYSPKQEREEDLYANPHTCPECNWQCSCENNPCSCCDGQVQQQEKPKEEESELEYLRSENARLQRELDEMTFSEEIGLARIKELEEQVEKLSKK